MSSILLTGGTGFLGSHIAEALVREGHTVKCTVRASSDTRWLDPLGVETFELDLSVGDDPETTRLEGIDTVVHCGALTRARNEAEFLAVNAGGTQRLARAAARAGVARYILISSLAARGPDGAGGPISPYGRSKAAAEAHARTQSDSMSVVVLRPGGVYGPRDADLLPLFRLVSRGWTIIPSSSIPLQPVYVDDVVAAVVAALTAPGLTDPIPIAGEGVHTWPDLAEALVSAVGPARVVRVAPAFFWTAGLFAELAARTTGKLPAMDRRRARDMSVHSWTCDIEGARRALDPWRPEVDIHDGLARTAAWYRDVGWL